MLPAQPDHGARPDRLPAFAHRNAQRVPVQIRARRHRLAQRKVAHLPDRFRAHAAGVGVVVAEDGAIVRALMAVDMRFGRDVRLHRPVPIQVVGRHVQHRRHRRTDRHQFQLKAAQFHHHQVGGRNLRQHVQQHRADVAPDERAPSRRAAHRAGERGGGGFARAARDAQHRRGAALQEKLRVVGHAHTAPLRFLHNRQRRRHAPAHTKHVAAVQQAQRMPAQRKTHVRPTQRRDHIRQLRLVARVGKRHLRPDRRQPAPQRLPLPPQPQHHHMRAVQRIAVHAPTSTVPPSRAAR